MTIFERIADYVESLFASLPQPMQAFIHDMLKDEGKILQGLVDTAVADVESAGFTTASFVAAAKDVFAKLIAQNISTFTLQNVFAAINLSVKTPLALEVSGVASTVDDAPTTPAA